MLSVLIAGSGGQGILFIGKLIAQAAMLEGKNVTWFPSYGAEMRGGTANCTVVISDDVIGSPIVRDTDILMVFNEASAGKFQPRLKKGGLLVMDSSLIGDIPLRDDIRVVKVPATKTAVSVGNPRAANMVVLGAAVASGLVREESVDKALKELTPERRKSDLKSNKAAVKAGMGFAGA